MTDMQPANTFDLLRSAVPGFQDLSDDDVVKELWRRGVAPTVGSRDELKTALVEGKPLHQKAEGFDYYNDPSVPNDTGSVLKGALDRLNAFGAGASHTLSMGQDDKAIAALQAIGSGVMPWSDEWNDAYERNRNIQQNWSTKTADENPAFNTAGEIGGAVVGTAMMPARAPWTGAGPLAKSAVQSAEFGALDQGARGVANGDQGWDLVKDVGHGAYEGGRSALIAGGLISGAGKVGGAVLNRAGDAAGTAANFIRDLPRAAVESKLGRSVLGDKLAGPIREMDKRFYENLMDGGLDLAKAGQQMKGDLLDEGTRWLAYKPLITAMRGAKDRFSQEDLYGLPLLLKTPNIGTGELRGTEKNIGTLFDNIWGKFTPEEQQKVFKEYFGQRFGDQLDVAAMRSKLSARSIDNFDKSRLYAQSGPEVSELARINRDYPGVMDRMKSLMGKANLTADEAMELSNLQKQATYMENLLTSSNVHRGIPGSIKNYFRQYLPGQALPVKEASGELIDVPLTGLRRIAAEGHELMGGSPGAVGTVLADLPAMALTGIPVPPLLTTQVGLRASGMGLNLAGDLTRGLTNPQLMGKPVGDALEGAVKGTTNAAMRLLRQPEEAISRMKASNFGIADTLEKAFNRGPDVYKAAVYKLMQNPDTRSQLERQFDEGN